MGMGHEHGGCIWIIWEADFFSHEVLEALRTCGLIHTFFKRENSGLLTEGFQSLAANGFL